MSTIEDFNRIDDCNKIDPLCIDAYTDFELDPDNEAGLCLHTPWGGDCLDLTSIVKAAESCTTLYLSPENNPNCLVYEPEEKCGDNICIHGDDLSRIISMTKLKDVSQDNPIGNGNVYMYNSETGEFEPYDLATTITNINTAIQNINAAVSNLQGRMTNAEAAITNLQGRVADIEAILTPPANIPSDARVLWGNINILSDYDAVVDGSGTATTLNRAHGVYGHDANIDIAYDELMG